MSEWGCFYPDKPYRYWQRGDVTVSWDGDDVAVEFDDVRRGVYIPPHVIRDSLPPLDLSLHDAMFGCHGEARDHIGQPPFYPWPCVWCTAADAMGAA